MRYATRTVRGRDGRFSSDCGSDWRFSECRSERHVIACARVSVGACAVDGASDTVYMSVRAGAARAAAAVVTTWRGEHGPVFFVVIGCSVDGRAEIVRVDYFFECFHF